MTQKTNFTRLVRLGGILSLIGIGISIVTIDIIGSYRDFNFRVDRMRENYISSQKQMIRQEVHRVVDMIRYEKSRSEFFAREKIKSRVYEAHSIAQHIYQLNKDTSTTDKIQQMIIDALSPIRFENGRGYYFAVQLDGTGILSINRPERKGKNLLNMRDSQGQYIVKQMIRIAKQSGEGFYEYYWIKPDAAGHNLKKISFIKQFEPYGWIIGSGLYVNDEVTQLKNNILSNISRIKFGREGYIFVNRLNGDALVSNGKVFPGTKKLWEVFDKKPDKMKYIFKSEYDAALKPDGDYIYYSFIKLTNSEKESPKVSYIVGIPEWQWLVGSGVYLDDVEKDIALMQSELNRHIISKIIYFSLIDLGIIAFFLLIFSRLNRRLRNDIDLFISFFNQAAFSDQLINRDLVHFDELDRMASNANKMLMDKTHARKELLDEREALRQSEVKFRGLVESSSDWIWEVNRQGFYTYASPQVETILGYKPEEIMGMLPIDLMPTEDAERISADIGDFVRKGKPIVTLEVIALHKDGRSIILETNGVPFFDSAGRVIGYRGVNRDITERKNTEEELQKIQRLKSIGILAGGIAHDFNNILMGLYGNISLAKEGLSRDHRSLKSLVEAENSMNRATLLTRQFLTFAKGGVPVREDVRVDGLIKEITRFDLSGSNIKPIFEQVGDLWIADVDKGQIQQVFSNLVINAAHAMPDGGHLYITMDNIAVSEDEIPNLNPGNYIRVTVRDEGTGINQYNIGKIFDPYFTTKTTGSGLGLTTVYSIINKHGGWICVDSQPGKGTTFTIYLPASESKDSSETSPSVEAYPLGEHSARILVMDDEDMICSMLKQMLESSGFTVKTASNGRQAIDMYKEAMYTGEPFDAVIMDLTIPGGIGGKEAILDLLKINPKARVIVSSGYTNDPVMANYAEYGFHGIAAKPYTRDKLLEILSRVLKN